MSGIKLEVDQQILKELLKRFDAAPDKIQKNATGVALTAGAKVVQKIARSKAPSCLKPTIKLANRKTQRKYIKKVSVVAGEKDKIKQVVTPDAARSLRKSGSNKIDCLPAMWVEFGTYGNRDYQGEEPYAPATLRKPSYSSGRSDSPYWDHKPKWIPAAPFLRPAMDSPDVEKAIAKRLGEYLDKKGF